MPLVQFYQTIFDWFDFIKFFKAPNIYLLHWNINFYYTVCWWKVFVIFVELNVLTLKILELLRCSILLRIQNVLFKLFCFEKEVIILFHNYLSTLIFEKVPPNLLEGLSLQVDEIALIFVMNRINQNGITIIIKIERLIYNFFFIPIQFDIVVVYLDHVGVVSVWVLLLFLDLVDRIHGYFFYMFKRCNRLTLFTFDYVFVIVTN